MPEGNNPSTRSTHPGRPRTPGNSSGRRSGPASRPPQHLGRPDTGTPTTPTPGQTSAPSPTAAIEERVAGLETELNRYKEAVPPASLAVLTGQVAKLQKLFGDELDFAEGGELPPSVIAIIANRCDNIKAMLEQSIRSYVDRAEARNVAMMGGMGEDFMNGLNVCEAGIAETNLRVSKLSNATAKSLFDLSGRIQMFELRFAQLKPDQKRHYTILGVLTAFAAMILLHIIPWTGSHGAGNNWFLDIFLGILFGLLAYNFMIGKGYKDREIALTKVANTPVTPRVQAAKPSAPTSQVSKAAVPASPVTAPTTQVPAGTTPSTSRSVVAPTSS